VNIYEWAHEHWFVAGWAVVLLAGGIASIMKGLGKVLKGVGRRIARGSPSESQSSGGSDG
jgi:hypothetical protein